METIPSVPKNQFTKLFHSMPIFFYHSIKTLDKFGVIIHVNIDISNLRGRQQNFEISGDRDI